MLSQRIGERVDCGNLWSECLKRPLHVPLIPTFSFLVIYLPFQQYIGLVTDYEPQSLSQSLLEIIGVSFP